MPYVRMSEPNPFSSGNTCGADVPLVPPFFLFPFLLLLPLLPGSRGAIVHVNQSREKGKEKACVRECMHVSVLFSHAASFTGLLRQEQTERRRRDILLYLFGDHPTVSSFPPSFFVCACSPPPSPSFLAPICIPSSSLTANP